MWAVISIKHKQTQFESLQNVLRSAFGESLPLNDILNRSAKYRMMPEADRDYFSSRIIFTMLGFHDSLVIFQIHSDCDFDCHLEPRNPGSPRDLYRACERLLDNIVNCLKRNKLKPSLKDIEIKFYQDSDEEVGVSGRYRPFRKVLGETFKNEGFLWGGFTAIVTIVVWLIKSETTIEIIRNSMITLISIPFFVFLLALVKTYFITKKIFYYVEK